MGRVIFMITGAAVAAAATVFLLIGPNDGDKLASMLGAVVAVVGLGVAVHQAVAGGRARPAPAETPSKYNVRVTRSWFVRVGDGE